MKNLWSSDRYSPFSICIIANVLQIHILFCLSLRKSRRRQNSSILIRRQYSKKNIGRFPTDGCPFSAATLSLASFRGIGRQGRPHSPPSRPRRWQEVETEGMSALGMVWGRLHRLCGCFVASLTSLRGKRIAESERTLTCIHFCVWSNLTVIILVGSR